MLQGIGSFLHLSCSLTEGSSEGTSPPLLRDLATLSFSAVCRGQGQAGGAEERMLYPTFPSSASPFSPRNPESPPTEEHVGNESFNTGFGNYMDCVPQLRGEGRAAVFRP